MHILPIIPARIESQRFPGKLLKSYKGAAVISWPIHQCMIAFGQCLLVTDSRQIADSADGECDILTTVQESYLNGTERIADACNRLNVADDTLIFHVQGDEVGLDPQDLVRLAQTARGSCVSTLFYCTEDEKLLKSMDHVKCWETPDLSFGFTRAFESDFHRIHVGVYCYRRDMLRRYTERWPTEDEKRERLEQLRWDVPIIAYEVAPCKSINRPEDLE